MKALSLTFLLLFAANCLAEATVSASVPDSLKAGPNHTVAESAAVEGFQNRYTVRTQFGDFEAVGPGDLRSRVKEVDALTYLEEMSRSKVFVESLKDAGVGSVSAIVGVFTRPVQTISGVPSGVQRLFSGFWKSAQRGAASTSRVLSRESADDMSAEDFRKLNYLVNDSEREWARELGVDPYSTNLKLRAGISNMAVVEFVGGLPVDVALPLAASLTVGVLGEFDAQLYEQDAVRLEASNRACMQEGGVDGETTEAVIEARYLTPTLQTIFCRNVGILAGVDGLSAIGRQLADSESFEESRFVLDTMSLVAWYQWNFGGLVLIEAEDGLVYGVSDASELVYLVPTSYLSSNELTTHVFEALKARGRRGGIETLTAWAPGQVSPGLAADLELAGWNLQTRDNNELLDAVFADGVVIAD